MHIGSYVRPLKVFITTTGVDDLTRPRRHMPLNLVEPWHTLQSKYCRVVDGLSSDESWGIEVFP